MTWTVTTAPAPILDWTPQIKANLNVVSDRDRLLVIDYIAQATAHAETMMQCSLAARTITATYDECDDEIVLPRGPILSIVSVTDNVEQPIVGYRVRNVGNRTTLDVSYRGSIPSPLTVVYQAGYAVLPADIVGMIRVHVATLYAWREDLSAATVSRDLHKLDEGYRFRSRGAIAS